MIPVPTEQNRIVDGPGYLMLKRMGWLGEGGLGRKRSGCLEPLELAVKYTSAGLGYTVGDAEERLREVEEERGMRGDIPLSKVN